MLVVKICLHVALRTVEVVQPGTPRRVLLLQVDPPLRDVTQQRSCAHRRSRTERHPRALQAPAEASLPYGGTLRAGIFKIFSMSFFTFSGVGSPVGFDHSAHAASAASTKASFVFRSLVHERLWM